MQNDPLFLLIGGVPGVGKTTLARELAHRLRVEQLVHTDTLKHVMQHYEPLTNPVFHNSYTAWRLFGTKTEQTVIRGMSHLCKHFEPLVRRFIEVHHASGKDGIVEGVHLLPGLKRCLNSPSTHYFLIVVPDAAEHWRRLVAKNARRHGRINLYWYANFAEIRLIQAFLIEEAKKHNVHVIENNDERKAVHRILEVLRHEAVVRL